MACKSLFMLFVVSLFFSSILNAREIPYTQEDRDRAIRLETKTEEGFKAINQRIDGIEKRIDGVEKRIDGVDKRIDGLMGLMYVIIGAVITQTLAVVGFVLWDRRTALAPAITKQKELEAELDMLRKKTREFEDKEGKIEKALLDYAQREPNFANSLRSANML